MTARSSWDWDDDDPEGDDRAHVDFIRARIHALERQLGDDEPPNEAALRDRLMRQLSWWAHQLEAALIDDHFQSGAGDRLLF